MFPETYFYLKGLLGLRRLEQQSAESAEYQQRWKGAEELLVERQQYRKEASKDCMA